MLARKQENEYSADDGKERGIQVKEIQREHPKVTYIGHSGFSVETGEVVLLFDYYRGEIPAFPTDAKIYVFSSHRHQDHFNFDIFQLQEKYDDVSYILSKDITKKYKPKYLQSKRGLSAKCCEAITSLDAGERYEDAYILVQAIPSTDIGVAFIVTDKAAGKVIYHAGDLNWWTWEGESAEEYALMTKAFQEDIACLKDYEIDIAFLPLDPRQGERFFLGFDYVMKRICIKKAYPMHCWDDFSVVDRLCRMECAREYRDRVVRPEKFLAKRIS